MITCRQVNPQDTKVYMGVLTDDVDVHTSLTQVAQKFAVHTATFEMLGGLSEVELSEYDFVSKTRQPAVVFKRAMEIVAGHGTISRLENDLHVHMHLTLSFRDEASPNGIAVIGGHVARAKAFAVEFTLTAYEGEPVQRKLDAATGLKLWNLSEL